ncbi:MAG: tyrosine-type recombinase/integrase [Sulfurimonas sp.]|nr:tyrosine-type recombinase/integrase [Sulfurimonas sp.]
MIIELFSTIFNYGIHEELYELVNPATKVKRYKIHNTRERFLRKNEIHELYSEVIKYDEVNENGSVLELFVKLALTTGARTEGILHIKKRDMDLQSDIIRIIDFKRGGMIYSGYVSDTSKGLLEKHLKKLNYNDYVVSFNHDGLKISIRKLQYRLKPILDDLYNTGLEIEDRKNRIVIHSLRHTFASLLAIADVSIRKIQELMNHADIMQTMKYAKLQDDETKKAVQNVF